MSGCCSTCYAITPVSELIAVYCLTSVITPQHFDDWISMLKDMAQGLLHALAQQSLTWNEPFEDNHSIMTPVNPEP